MNLDKLVNKDKAVDAKTVVTSTTSWRVRIIEFMTSLPAENPAATHREILEATDDKLTDDNYNKRKHCLASQLTYIRQDQNIVTRTVEEEKIVFLGVRKDKEVYPFHNAESYFE